MRLTKKEHKEKRTLKREKKRERIKRDKTYVREGIVVDSSKWGANNNTDYWTIPEYYYDINYDCIGCGIACIWIAQQQKYFFEELGGNINSAVVRCQVCSAHIQAIKEEQQRHMAKMAEKKPHNNEAFFQKRY